MDRGVKPYPAENVTLKAIGRQSVEFLTVF
jgi:hypothetical protein